MKRIITTLFFYLFTVGSSHAETVKVPSVWGFAIGSTQGSYFRAILDQANQEQNKYTFTFEHRPGAGGAIAARHVLDYKGGPIILAHSSAFFVRPNLYPDTPYRVGQFRPLLIMGSAPGVLMTRGKTLDQLLKQPRIILGTAGAGSSTHLMAETFKRYVKNSDVTMVHFKDSNEAYVNVLGGHVDGTFEFLGDAKAKATNEVVFAGLTGRVSIDGIPVLRDRGMTDMENLSAIFAIYVPNTMDSATYNEIRSILLSAEKHESVQSLYRRDFTYRDPRLQQQSQLKAWYDNTIVKFRELTTGIKVE